MTRLEILDQALITARAYLVEYGNHIGSCYFNDNGCSCGYYDALDDIDKVLQQEIASDATGTY